MPTVLWAGIGGALGSMLRYSIGLFSKKMLNPAFFFAGTLLVNLVGCFCIGVAFGWVQTRPHPPWIFMAAVQAGFLGGFTTFSSFGLETLQLWREQSIWVAAGYVTISLFAGLALVGLGLLAARWVWGS